LPEWADRHNIDDHLSATRAVSVLLADCERVILNAASWNGEQLPNEIASKLFEDAEHATSALAHSWIITPEDDPARWIEWATHYRSARDAGDSVSDALACADDKIRLAPTALDEFIAETEAEVTPIIDRCWFKMARLGGNHRAGLQFLMGR